MSLCRSLIFKARLENLRIIINVNDLEHNALFRLTICGTTIAVQGINEPPRDRSRVILAKYGQSTSFPGERSQSEIYKIL